MTHQLRNPALVELLMIQKKLFLQLETRTQRLRASFSGRYVQTETGFGRVPKKDSEHTKRNNQL